MIAAAAPAGAARLFFALWPDAAAAQALAEAARALVPVAGGRALPAANLHLTLAFLGEVDAAALAEALAVPVAGPAFAMTLDCVGAFRRARVAWAGASAPPAALLDLQSGLAATLRGRGFALESRAFAPHVTLLRHIESRVPPAPIAPISWRVEALALVRSQGGRYASLAQWRLGD